MPPASAAAAIAAFDVIEEEPERIHQLQRNTDHFGSRLRSAGFTILETQTAIMPIMCGDTELSLRLANYCQKRGIFVQAIAAPVVPEGMARLRACVCATHTIDDIDYCVDTLIEGANVIGGILERQFSYNGLV